jgi:fructuronate reductase
MTASPRLQDATLRRDAGVVRLPAYDRSAVGIGQAHLGVGAFFKAHQAVYTEAAIAARDGDWRIRGVSLRRPDMRDALAPQDGLYTVVSADAGGEERRIIGALADVLVAPEDPAAVVSALADPRVKIITLTITEKGYCLSPATGALDLAHPEIAADLDAPERPTTAIGFLAAAFRRRIESGVALPAVVSCDNLPSNGARLRAAMLAYANAFDARLHDAIAEQGDFPCTMVDRIVPAATEDFLASLAAATGYRDEAAIRTEPFSQWVIEDRFRGPRPAWEAGGALIARDVAPFELAKLRLLNGAHSAIAYLGYLAGHEHVADAMSDPRFAQFVEALQEREIAPLTPAPDGMPLGPYMAALRARFANPTLRHRTWQIAMDGSQKLPQRLLDTIRAALAAGRPIDRLTLAVAAWTQYVSGVDERGAPIDVRDPLRAKLAAAAQAGGAVAADRARAFLSIREVFGDDLPGSARFRTALERAIGLVRERGAAGAVGHIEGGAA